MSRTRLILLGLLVAAVAVGAVVSSSSGAEPQTAVCSTVATAPGYCVGESPLVNASEKFEGTDSGESILKATISGVKAEIKCSAGKSKGSIEGGAAGTVGKSTVTDAFETCKMIKPTTCKLTAAGEKEIKTTMLKGELVLTAGRIEDKLEPKEGAAFAGISIEGKESTCVIAEVGKPKTFNVIGSQLCEVDLSNTEAEKEEPTHKIICKDSGSSLEVGGKAEMASEATVKLGKNWSVKET